MANEITTNKGGLLSGLVVGVIVVGSVAGYVFTGKNSAAQSTAAPPPGGAPPPAAPASPPIPGPPGSAAALGSPKKPAAPAAAAPKARTTGSTPPSKVLTNSWDESGAAAAPTAPAAPAGAPPAPGAAPAAPAADASKPAPIVQGQLAAGYRSDPFVSFTRRLVEEIPAYQLIAHLRLASRPRPTPPPLPSDPYTRFGPLPQVERRVAGILFDGSVSAILETGTPGGASTRVSVIQPGALVPSGVPGLRDLTVASITKNEVVLRADDGRTTTVKLSSVPAAYAEAFRGAASGGDTAGSGGPPQGPGGPPPGAGGPGKPNGGRGRPSASSVGL